MPRLLLHACCAPCSSAVLEYLSQYFLHHAALLIIPILPLWGVRKRGGGCAGLSNAFCPPGGAAPLQLQWAGFCRSCPRLRGGAGRGEALRSLLPPAAGVCHEEGSAPSLTGTTPHTCPTNVSHEEMPAFESAWGKAPGEKCRNCFHLPSDFKKKDSYKHSIRLFPKYGLYRQDFLTAFSEAQRQRERRRKDQLAVAHKGVFYPADATPTSIPERSRERPRALWGISTTSRWAIGLPTCWPRAAQAGIDRFGVFCGPKSGAGAPSTSLLRTSAGNTQFTGLAAWHQDVSDIQAPMDDISAGGCGAKAPHGSELPSSTIWEDAPRL